MLHLSEADGRWCVLRDRCGHHADSPDTESGSQDRRVPDRDQSAAERLATERLQRVAAGWTAGDEPRPADACQRDEPAAMRFHEEHQMQPERSGERGLALVIVMFMVMTMSLVGASLIFVSRTETLGSRNYQTDTQSRYAAEAGISAA